MLVVRGVVTVIVGDARVVSAVTVVVVVARGIDAEMQSQAVERIAFPIPAMQDEKGFLVVVVVVEVALMVGGDLF